MQRDREEGVKFCELDGVRLIKKVLNSFSANSLSTFQMVSTFYKANVNYFTAVPKRRSDVHTW